MIGAAHAGWRGALDGVLEATLAAMERLGARPGAVRAAVGPTISQRAYEVGPEFFDRFRDEEAGYERFFAPGRGRPAALRPARASCSHRLRDAGVAEAGWIGACTHSDPDALLLLPPRHPRRRARLRPADLGHPPLNAARAGSRVNRSLNARRQMVNADSIASGGSAWRDWIWDFLSTEGFQPHGMVPAVAARTSSGRT